MDKTPRRVKEIPAGSAGPAQGAPVIRKRDAERTYEDIIKVATKEFAQHGLSGGRVDDIAEKTRTTKRMIYYYFGSKEGLYTAVLTKAYAGIRNLEKNLRLEDAEPEAAIRRLVDFTFDYHEEHTEFVRLVMIENIHRAEYLIKSDAARNQNSAAIDALVQVLRRGFASGIFKRKIDPIDLHMLISAFCFFRSSNRYTFGSIFQRDFSKPKLRQAHKRLIADAIIALLKQTE